MAIRIIIITATESIVAKIELCNIADISTRCLYTDIIHKTRKITVSIIK